MIFCFSAAGNSQKLADTIAARIDEKIISIEDALKNGQFNYTLKDTERFGLVFPVFCGSVPDIVKSFISQLHVATGERYYGYIAVTNGGDAGLSLSQCARLLLAQGISVTGYFEAVTVDTCAILFLNHWENSWQTRQEKAALSSAFISEQIADRTNGNFIKSAKFPHLTTFFYRALYPWLRRTSHFHVTDKCTQCGQCIRNCPISAISQKDGIPVWQSKSCMMCLRCLHQCPAQAIEFDHRTLNKPRFRMQSADSSS